LGLCAGLVATALAWRCKAKRRFLLPFGACAASGLLLGVAFWFPAQLGPIYQGSRLPPTPPMTGLRAVPLIGAVRVIAAPEWTDASKFALQRGALRVQVVKVSRGALPARREKPAPSPKEFLLVHVRVQGPPALGKKDRDPAAFAWTDQRRPTLTDAAGKTYALKERVDDPVGAKARPETLLAAVDEVFAFEPPPADVDFLKLDLPGAERIGGDNFRVTIPATMIAPAPKNAK
jgi:hypothetical protein